MTSWGRRGLVPRRPFSFARAGNMSAVSEALDITRASIEAFNRGDLDGAIASAHPDVVWYVYLSPDGEVAHGIDAVKEMWRERQEVFGNFQWDVEEFIEVEPWVLAVGQLRGLAPGAGSPEVAAPMVQMYRIVDDQLHEVCFTRTKDEALALARGTA